MRRFAHRLIIYFADNAFEEGNYLIPEAADEYEYCKEHCVIYSAHAAENAHGFQTEVEHGDGERAHEGAERVVDKP